MSAVNRESLHEEEASRREESHISPETHAQFIREQREWKRFAGDEPVTAVVDRGGDDAGEKLRDKSAAVGSWDGSTVTRKPPGRGSPRKSHTHHAETCSGSLS